MTVSRLENGQWVSGTEFTDGDSVWVEIHYTVPEHTVGEDNQTIQYQLPDGIQLSQQEQGPVNDGQTSVGAYVIDTDGMITITFDESFSDDKPFTGMIQFKGILSADGDGSDQEINFGGDGGTIMVKPGKEQTDIHIEKMVPMMNNKTNSFIRLKFRHKKVQRIQLRSVTGSAQEKPTQLTIRTVFKS